MGTLGRAASLVLATRWRVVPALSVELGVPGRRAAVFCTCWLSMRCANSAAFVAFCTGLWVSNPALVQGQASGGRPGSDCEVCKEFLNRFYNSLIINEVNFTPDTIEKELISFCLDAKGKENRLCYYLGATKDAATKILSGVTGPMSVHMPAGKICEKLKKMDSQICELKYGTNRAKFFFQYV